MNVHFGAGSLKKQPTQFATCSPVFVILFFTLVFIIIKEKETARGRDKGGGLGSTGGRRMTGSALQSDGRCMRYRDDQKQNKYLINFFSDRLALIIFLVFLLR